MFKLTAELAKICADYDVTYRIRMEGGTVQRDKDGKALRDDANNPIVSSGTLVADIIDIPTGVAYIMGRGDDGLSAVEDGLRKVPDTEKPKTKAQELIASKDKGLSAMADRLAELERENAALKKDKQKLLDTAPQTPDAPPKRKGGRPRKHPLPEVVAPA